MRKGEYPLKVIQKIISLLFIASEKTQICQTLIRNNPPPELNPRHKKAKALLANVSFFAESASNAFL